MAGWCAWGCHWVFLLFYGLSAQADDLPSMVYRVDVRDPVVDWRFQQGFLPAGQNDDLVAHVAGVSVLNGGSAFVSTTDHRRVAEQIAIARLQQGNSLVWIYEIRASDSFYEVNASLHHAIRQLAMRDGHGSVQMNNLESLEALYGHQYEWVATRIPSELIRSARAYRLAAPTAAGQDDRLIEEPHTYLLNPNYREAATSGNQHPWPILPAQANVPPGQLHSLRRGSRAIGLGWCAVAMGGVMSPRLSRSLSALPEPDCLHPVTPAVLTVGKVWDSSLNALVRRPVPWESEVTQESGGEQIKPKGCRIEVENDVLQVFCPPSTDYSHYVVQLKASGIMLKWVDTSFLGGRTDIVWQRTSRDIPVHNTRWKLADYGYAMRTVFRPHGGAWSSSVIIAPYYPDLTYAARQKRASATEVKAQAFSPEIFPSHHALQEQWQTLPFWGR
jgi:hypothetical protein